jgi:di/tricarboxylate transporter
MVANGANAGNLSPLSAVGVIANSKMAGVGLGGHALAVWAANFAAHALVAGLAWLAFQVLGTGTSAGQVAAGSDATLAPLTTRQVVTLIVITAWIACVVGLELNVGLSAFCAAVVLIVGRMGDETAAIKRMPWGAILMVSGVSVLLGVVDKTGGMELFTKLLSQAATPGTINGVMAFLTGVISTYSSTSGVVLPTFLPTVPGLVQQVGGGDPLAVALSINVGSSLVDVSPLSTLGALCVASVADADTARSLFRNLLIWGLSMTIVGALLCQLFAGLFARL